MKRNFLTVAIGAVLIVIFALLLFVFQVRQSEVAVVTTFGKPMENPYELPGAYFKWPWPIQRVYKYDKRVQSSEDKYSEVFTGDAKTLSVSVYFGWRITSPAAFLQNFPQDPSVSVPNAQSQIESIVRSAKLAMVGKHPLSDLVNADPKSLKFDALETEIEQTAESTLESKNYGVKLEFLGIKRMGFPEAVVQAVFTRMSS